MRIIKVTFFVIVSALLAACGGSNNAPVIDLVIMATTDIHNSYMDYDYFTDTPTERFGLVRIASAVREYRTQNANLLLFDNGDNIQGNPMGEFLAKNPPGDGEISPIMSLMNFMGYDAMNIGNHEFNFGLDYLNSVIPGASFPVISANVLDAVSKEPYFTPYVVLPKVFTDRAGVSHTVNVGILGLLPPAITTWDGSYLRGRVETQDAYEAALHYVPLMQEEGADIIVILAHGGIADFERRGREENFAYYVTNIAGVDAVISGHSHARFPSPAFARIGAADVEMGTINGIPVVNPGSFADAFGVINLTFTKAGDKWERTNERSEIVDVWDSVEQRSSFEPYVDSGTERILSELHLQVVNFINSPVGGNEESGISGARLMEPLTSFFSIIRDEYSVQIINDAQIHYAKQVLADTPFSGLPVISAAAPFKAGGRNGPSYFTNVPAGPIAIRHIADIYVYPNTVVIMKMTGAEMKEWLEMSAGQFNLLNSGSDEQFIQNESFPTYNFDVIEGLTYRIDTTVPAKYGRDGTVVNAGSERIRDLSFENSPVRPEQEFAVVTNNYRSYGGGNFPGVSPDKIILETPDESRQVILQYIEFRQVISPAPSSNWSLMLPFGGGPFLFSSSPSAMENLPGGISFVRMNEEGFAVYRVEP